MFFFSLFIRFFRCTDIQLMSRMVRTKIKKEGMYMHRKEGM